MSPPLDQPLAADQPVSHASDRRLPRIDARNVLRGISPAGGLAWMALGLSALLLWFVGFTVLLGALSEHSDQHRLYGSFREQLAEAKLPLGGTISSGAPVALMTVGAADIHNAVVVEGSSSRETVRGPGHLPGTPLPGQAGQSVIFGRGLAFGGVFRSIRRLPLGALINVTTGEGSFSYKVTDVRRGATPAPALTVPRLTLVSAYGEGWRSGWAPSSVVYVDAGLVGKTAATPPGPVSIPSPDDAAMSGGHGGVLLPLSIWLELSAGAVGFTVWATRRWSRRQAWLVGAPLIIAAIWGASTTGALLLPNLT